MSPSGISMSKIVFIFFNRFIDNFELNYKFSGVTRWNATRHGLFHSRTNYAFDLNVIVFRDG